MINGAPGVGKSTLARRYADGRALALIVDVDDIRRQLGGWREHDESKIVARDLAIALARDHLERGYDVIIPQYLARPEFRDRMRGLADQVGTTFVETVLTDDDDAVIERFQLRRREYASSGADHPEAELADDALSTEIPQAIEHLLEDAADRGVTTISAREGLEVAYDALLRCVASQASARTLGTRQYAHVKVEVLGAELHDKPVLRQLLQLYQYDFSEFDNSDTDGDGFYRYPYFDDYWIEPERHPLLFRVDGKWAGFALVRAGIPHDMAEFFVMRKYRRSGVGTRLAREVFTRFPGDWQVRQMTSNPSATAFWRRAIPVDFEEDMLDHGPVQRFAITL